MSEAVEYHYTNKTLIARQGDKRVLYPGFISNEHTAERIVQMCLGEYGKFTLPDWFEQNTKAEREPENSGGHCEYYHALVDHPQNPNQTDPYIANCEDIIQALGLTFDEGCVFKVIWRTARGRQGYKKAQTSAVRDAAKAVHYSQRILAYEQRKPTEDLK